MLELDHIAFAAETLEDGRDAVEAALGVALQPGGEHVHFGTHNMLLGFDDGLYFEVITVNPNAPKLPHARWFDLDRFTGAPRLSNWICRTNDLAGMLRRYPQAGQAVPLARGDLCWQMAVPTDGRLPYDNCFPALMEWQCDRHPAQMLAASGCRLRRLTVSHPQAQALVDELPPELDQSLLGFETGEAGLRAEIDTPHGARVLT